MKAFKKFCFRVLGVFITLTIALILIKVFAPGYFDNNLTAGLKLIFNIT